MTHPPFSTKVIELLDGADVKKQLGLSFARGVIMTASQAWYPPDERATLRKALEATVKKLCSSTLRSREKMSFQKMVEDFIEDLDTSPGEPPVRSRTNGASHGHADHIGPSHHQGD